MTVHELKKMSRALKAYERAMKTVSRHCALPAVVYEVQEKMHNDLARQKDIAIRLILNEELSGRFCIDKIKEIVNA